MKNLTLIVTRSPAQVIGEFTFPAESLDSLKQERFGVEMALRGFQIVLVTRSDEEIPRTFSKTHGIALEKAREATVAELPIFFDKDAFVETEERVVKDLHVVKMDIKGD